MKKHINRMMPHRKRASPMDSGERNVLWLPEGHGLYKRKARLIQFIPNIAAISQQFTTSWTRSIPAASPADPAHSALSRRTSTHTFLASSSYCCQVCYVFPVRAERNLG